jgi:glycosyltransferase involved in cell wall biosynthesis
VRQAVRRLAGRRIDILHSHRYKENVLAWLVARRLGITSVVTTIHGVSEATTEGRVERWWAPCRRWVDYTLLKRRFSAAVAVSEEMKRVLVDRYGLPEHKMRVIRNGGRFPVAGPVTHGPDCGGHLGTVSRLVPVKGLDLFLDVAAMVARISPAARFSILGDGPLRESLERKAEDLGLAGRVQFLAPRPDPFPYYRSLDVYLNTSLHEGLPLSVVEAMACGLPIVSAAVGGIPEIVEHGRHGYLVRGRDARVFAEHCLSLLQDEPGRRAMGERASATAHAQLSAPAMAASYRDLYETLSAPMRIRATGEPIGAAQARTTRPRCEA